MPYQNRNFIFRVYDPTTLTKLGDLPDVESFSLTASLNDHATLNFKYPRQGRNFEFIRPGSNFELVVFSRATSQTDLGQANAYKEAYCSRFIPWSVDYDYLDEDGSIDYQMVSFSQIARRILVAENTTTAPPDSITLTGTEYGVVSTLAAPKAGRNRGGPGFSVANVDLGGATTTGTISHTYQLTDTLDDSLRALADAGQILWVPNGRGIAIMAPAGTGPLNSQVVASQRLVPYAGGATPRVNYDWSQWVTATHADWDGRASLAWNDASSTNGTTAIAATPWGHFEAAVSAENATVAALATKKVTNPKTASYTYTVDLSASDPLYSSLEVAMHSGYPLADWTPGQYIQALILSDTDYVTPVFAYARIMSFNLVMDAEGNLRADVELERRFVSPGLRLARTLSSIKSKSYA